jgi:predicted Zn-ribbon and HTH transcriptional regulator
VAGTRAALATPPASQERRPPLEVADVFRAHGEDYVRRHRLTPDQLKVMRDIVACRTAVLGGHLDVCPDCGHERPSYNSCRNRHCPKCQATAAAIWLEARQQRLLPVPYFHVVFTLPAALRVLCQRNPVPLYKVLFASASKTLLELGQDPERLGAQLGFSAILHTWTRTLEYHPHLHCIVTGGGLNAAGDQWVPTRPDYLFPVRVLGALFRGKFLDGLLRRFAAGDLVFGPGCTELAVPEHFRCFVDRRYAEDWVVYAKPPFAGPEHVYQYLGRYTHRVGLSNQRLLHLDDRGVTFLTKGGASLTLAPDEFIRRFLQHVLPAGFTKIRHYGLLAPAHVHGRLHAARRLLTAAAPAACPPPPPLHESRPGVERVLARLGVDPMRCPACGSRLNRKPCALPPRPRPSWPWPRGHDTS